MVYNPFKIDVIQAYDRIKQYFSSYYPKKKPISLLHIRDFICYNQGKYAQYNFLTSRRHRDLKDELRKPSAVRDKTKIANLVTALERHINYGLDNAYTESFDRIIKCFEGRSKHKLRVCIKAQNKDGDIVDLFRSKRNYFGKSYSIDTNTGFKYVFENAQPFICNTIPDQAKKSLYKNPRLIPAAVSSYELTRKEKKKIYKDQQIDAKWMSCWHPPKREDGKEGVLTPEACYKSTLIIPMTLIGASLDSEFRDMFEISSEAEHRGIWGYLCFDNHMENYFDEESDVHCGYIFADILSLYLITRLTYTAKSVYYAEAKNLLT